MFSKTLFLVVLCLAVVLANAAPEPQKRIRIRETVDSIEESNRILGEKTENLLNKIKRGWSAFWNRVRGIDGERKLQEFDALKSELIELQKDCDRALSAVRAEWQPTLQKLMEELKRLRDDRKETSKVIETLRKLDLQHLEVIIGIFDEWNQKADKLVGRIDKAVST